MNLVAGVDVGGTNIGVGFVRPDHHVTDRAKRRTADSAKGIVKAIVEMVGDLDGEPAAIGVGLPGVIHEGRVRSAPHLVGWTPEFDFVARLGHELGIPVVVGNDVNVGILGEWTAGAAKKASSVLGIWMGTGIGGGLILDGRPYVGSLGGAGEIGHTIIHAGGQLCPCGRRGCVEAYAGRRAMEGFVEVALANGRHSEIPEIQRRKGKSEATSSVWAKALHHGDPLATELFDGAIRAVATGAASAVNLLALELVVIGGGFAEKLGQDLADRIAEAAQPLLLGPSPELRFVAAKLGDDSGIVGAAELARGALTTTAGG